MSAAWRQQLLEQLDVPRTLGAVVRLLAAYPRVNGTCGTGGVFLRDLLPPGALAACLEAAAAAFPNEVYAAFSRAAEGGGGGGGGGGGDGCADGADGGGGGDGDGSGSGDGGGGGGGGDGSGVKGQVGGGGGGGKLDSCCGRSGPAALMSVRVLLGAGGPLELNGGAWVGSEGSCFWRVVERGPEGAGDAVAGVLGDARERAGCLVGLVVPRGEAEERERDVGKDRGGGG